MNYRSAERREQDKKDLDERCIRQPWKTGHEVDYARQERAAKEYEANHDPFDDDGW